MNKKVLLFLSQGFEELEAAAFTDVMGWSRVEGLVGVNLDTTGFHNQIQGNWNFKVQPEISFNDVVISEYDALAIPGGFEEAGFYTDVFDTRFLELIKTFNEQKKIIASVCVGALPVGKSGVLSERKATTYDLSNRKRINQLSDFNVHISDENIVVDDNIISSTGPGTALDVAFKLLELLTSNENVIQVKRYMRIL